MKFATDKSHRDYFYKHGTIEFEGLFTPTQINEINAKIDEILCKNLAIKSYKLAKQNAQEIFKHGRDLFRHDEALKKLLLHKRLANIAVELLEVRSIRMGYDQLLVGEVGSPLLDPMYDQFLQQEGTLQEKSCMTPVVCGLMLCLEPPQTEVTSIFFPKTPGHVIFFRPNIPLDLKFLTQVQGGRYLLMTYADRRTVYILNEKDPHTHTLKHRGYVFGDKLSDSLNPIIYR